MALTGVRPKPIQVLGVEKQEEKHKEKQEEKRKAGRPKSK